MAATLPEQLFNSPLEVELIAIFRRLQLCLPLGILSLMVESDSLVAVHVIQEGETALAHHRTILKEILRVNQKF